MSNKDSHLLIVRTARRVVVFGFIFLFSFILTNTAQAEATEARPYKISVLIFEHSPAYKNTAPRLMSRWTQKMFADSMLITTPSLTDLSNYNVLLPMQQSSLEGPYQALSKNKDYTILYNGTWITPLRYQKTKTFHLHNVSDRQEILDALINVTLKYDLEVRFQTQWLIPIEDNNYKIIALDESYQTASNRTQYIDGPVYGALIKISRY